MRKILLSLAALVVASTASAGTYHRQNRLVCTDCHTMHSSRQHGNVGAGSGLGFTGTRATGYDRLLIMNGTNATCFACHKDQTNAPDVMGASDALAPYPADGQRSAGRLNELGDGAPIENTGHTMGWLPTATLTGPPGFNAANVSWLVPTATWGTEEFNCADCHTPHGGAQYRNIVNGYSMRWSTQLSGTAGTAFTFTDGAKITPSETFTALDTANEVYNSVGYGAGTFSAAGYYAASSIQYGTAATAVHPNKFNQFCAQCHGNFHGDANTIGSAPGLFQRHPTTGVSAAATTLWRTAAAFDPATMAAKGNWVDGAAKTTFEPGCVTCHKAHGTGNDYGLIFPAVSPTGTDAANLEQGTGTVIRGLCSTCHPMGRF
jgi:hypothetical protein